MCFTSRSGGSRAKSNGIHPLHYGAGFQGAGLSSFVFRWVFYLSNRNHLINIFQMCVNADVRKEKGASLNHSCRALVSAQACKYHRNVKGGYRRVICRRISHIPAIIRCSRVLRIFTDHTVKLLLGIEFLLFSLYLFLWQEQLYLAFIVVVRKSVEMRVVFT